MPANRQRVKLSARKSARPRKSSEKREPIEATVADKVMHGPESAAEKSLFAFAEEEAEIVPADMIDTLQYKQVRSLI